MEVGLLVLVAKLQLASKRAPARIAVVATPGRLAVMAIRTLAFLPVGGSGTSGLDDRTGPQPPHPDGRSAAHSLPPGSRPAAVPSAPLADSFRRPHRRSDIHAWVGWSRRAERQLAAQVTLRVR